MLVTSPWLYFYLRFLSLLVSVLHEVWYWFISRPPGYSLRSQIIHVSHVKWVSPRVLIPTAIFYDALITTVCVPPLPKWPATAQNPGTPFWSIFPSFSSFSEESWLAWCKGHPPTCVDCPAVSALVQWVSASTFFFSCLWNTTITHHGMEHYQRWNTPIFHLFLSHWESSK